jgi:hypothetical protein
LAALTYLRPAAPPAISGSAPLGEIGFDRPSFDLMKMGIKVFLAVKQDFYFHGFVH